MRAYSLLIGFVSTFVTIRFLGAENYGVYATALIFYQGVLTLSTLGLGQTLVPTLTRAVDAEQPGRIAGLVVFGLKVTLLAASFLIALTMALSGPIGDEMGLPPGFPPVLALMMVAGAVTAHRQILASYLRGTGRVAVVFAFTRGLRPTLLVIALGALWGVGALLPTLPRLLALTVAIVLLDASVFYVLWRWFRPTAAPERVGRDAKRHLASVTYPVTIQRLKDVAQASTGRVLVAVLTHRLADVGFLTLAQKLASLVGFPRMMLAASFAPIASELHVQGRLGALRHAYRLTALLSLVGASGLGLMLGLWGPTLLPVFGKGFDLTFTPLVIMAGSLLVGILLGPAQATLVMTERTRVLGALAPFEFALNLGLGLLWIPDLGLLGAVYAGVAAAQLRHITLAGFLAWRTGIHAFGWPLIVWLGGMVAAGIGCWGITQALAGLPGVILATVVGLGWYLAHARNILKSHGLSARELVRLPTGLRQARKPGVAAK
ncbi:MAG: O-antigen/teichoic acid export membrane protein [Myxococcota bacterium]|jgi:O-antigen/teichoic acid export membrane protein